MLLLQVYDETGVELVIDPRELLRQNPNGEPVKILVRLLRWPNGSHRLGFEAPRYVEINRTNMKQGRKRQKGGDQ